MGKSRPLSISISANQIREFGSSQSLLTCERRRISGCHLVPPKNNVCEPEPENDFCDVMTFVPPWPIRFHDTMKLECSLQRIPRAVVLGLFELNCDWLRIPTSQKSFPGSGSQTLFFGGTKWQPEIRLRSQEKTCTVFLSSYRNTRESLGELEKLWKHSPPARVPTAFLVLPNFHSCIYNSIETQYMFSFS